MTRASDKPSGALTPSRALRAAEILEQALDAPPSRQLDVVRAASGGDEAMEREVLSLLGAHANAGAFLQPPLRGATLEPGTLLGTYRVIERIGAGGMGEVYRARDEVLGRSVAIKVLSDERARDASHVARLEREARSLAALNHPNIAAIYAVQSARDGHGPALVLELAAGKTLAQVLERGPLAVDDAVAIATQVARALEAAHGAGIVHRDLKPANVAIADDGTVKVLDFGLAKSTNEVEIASGSGAGLSPVVTQAGMLLGTVAYMSPEQARGKAIDRRADMWAFGCVLYEMLTGKRLLAGDDVAVVFQRVVAGEVDLTNVPATTPTRVRRVLERCLRKDLDKRMRDAGDARVELEESLIAEPIVSPPRQRTPWLLAAAGVLAVVAGGLYVGRTTRAPARMVLNEQYSVLLPEDSPIVHHFGSPVSMRSGTRDLYYTTLASSGVYRVVRRRAEDGRLDSEGFLPGEAFGSVSPDSRRLVYWRSEQGEVSIRVRDLASGADVAQHAVSNAWNGVGWINDHTLAIAKFEEEDRLLVWDFAADRAWSPKNIDEGIVVQPDGVGDGRTLVMTLHQSSAGNLSRSIFAWRDDLPKPVKLVDDAQMPKVFGGDLLLFYRDDGIWAVKLDIANLRTTGPEISIIAGLSPDTDTTTCGMYNVTSDGDLLYLPTSQTYQGAKLAWIDDKSQQTDILQVEAQMMALRLSPDAKKIAYVAGGTTPDLFVHDLARGTSWIAAKGHVVLPVWTRDSESIIFQFTPGDGSGAELRRVRYDGSSPPETLFKMPDRVWAQPTDVTPDDKYLLVAKLVGPKDESDIVRYALDGSGASELVFSTHADRTNARLSADGTLLAYTSKESGEWAVYVQPYPSLDRKVRVSATAAFRLSWQRDSNTLFYRGGSDVYSVDVTTSPKFSVSAPVLRFKDIPESRFDASPDGTRIVQSLPLKKYASLRELRIWLGAEQVIRERLDVAAKAAKR